MGKNKMAFIVYVLPVLVFITLVVYIPFIMSMCYSFTEWNGISREAKFIGLENFKIIFTEDGSFKDSALFTLKFSVLFIVTVYYPPEFLRELQHAFHYLHFIRFQRFYHSVYIKNSLCLFYIPVAFSHSSS